MTMEKFLTASRLTQEIDGLETQIAELTRLDLVPGREYTLKIADTWTTGGAKIAGEGLEQIRRLVTADLNLKLQKAREEFEKL